MKKYGFTLAEVLIALAIIGIVAALTAPTFINRTQNASNASRLASTVSTLENAFTNMLTKEDVDSLYDTRLFIDDENNGTRAQFAGNLGDYVSVAGFEDWNSTAQLREYYNNNGPHIMNRDATVNRNVDDDLATRMTVMNRVRSHHFIKLKNGSILFMHLMDDNNMINDRNMENRIRRAGGSLYIVAAAIAIDVNGAAAPNTLGRDIFCFYLGEDGKLYPEGGNNASIFLNQNLQNTWYNNGFSRCDYGRANVVGGSIANGGYGCAGRVVDDGYKINY